MWGERERDRAQKFADMILEFFDQQQTYIGLITYCNIVLVDLSPEP